jgi:two-component sensor histidine kinase
VLFKRTIERFAAGPEGLQRFVGITIGAAAFLIDVLNVLSLLRLSDYNILTALSDWYVISIALTGVLAIITGFWISPIAKWAQALIFFLTAILSATTSREGELTSGIFLAFGLILIYQYSFGRYSIWVGAIFTLVLYPLALAKGIGSISSAFLTQVAAIVVMMLCLIVLYGSVLLRHELRHRDDLALLESRVKERTAELEKALAERSVMLQEIHHRVNNNLQVIASMLRLEADRLEDSSQRGSIESSIQRINAMALVHGTAYATEQLDRLDLVNYADRLLDASRDISSIEYTLSAEGPIPVGIDFAVPFGLLLNELVSNAERHAFPEGFQGRVDIRIESGDGILLSFVDNGVGMSENFRIEGTKTLGLSLVNILTQQLRGDFALGGKPGTSWTFRFPA